MNTTEHSSSYLFLMLVFQINSFSMTKEKNEKEFIKTSQDSTIRRKVTRKKEGIAYGMKTRTRTVCNDVVYFNATLAGGMRGKIVHFLGKVDGMRSCIKMSCARNHTNFALLLNHNQCYAIICKKKCEVSTQVAFMRYSTQLAELSKTVVTENIYMSPEHRIIQDVVRKIPGKDVRPTKNYNDRLNIKLTIRPIQILDINEISQALTLNVWTTQEWSNPLLTWNSSEHSGIKQVNVDPSMVWTPLIILHNNADPEMGGLYTLKTKVIVNSNGWNTWFASTTLTSSCKINVKYFPFDEQICYLRFGSWSYPADLLNIDFMNIEKAMENFAPSAEWDVIKFDAKREVTYYPCCKKPFSEVVYMIRLRRKALYYIYTLILPSTTITALMGLGFLLPPNSGERITLGVTILVTISVYLNLASKKLPATSDHIPLLSLFYFLLFIQIGLSVSATGFTLKFFFRQNFSGPIPEWMRKLIVNHLAKLLQVPKLNAQKPDKSKSVIRRRKLVRFNDKIEVNGNETHSHSSSRSRFTDPYLPPINGNLSPCRISEDSFLLRDSSSALSGRNTQVEYYSHSASSRESDFVPVDPDCLALPLTSNSVSDSISDSIQLFDHQFRIMNQQSRKRTQQIIYEDVDAIVENEHKKELKRFHVLEWHYVSVVIDRIFMILFVLSLVVSTSVMLLRPKDDAVTEWGSHF